MLYHACMLYLSSDKTFVSTEDILPQRGSSVVLIETIDAISNVRADNENMFSKIESCDGRNI